LTYKKKAAKKGINKYYKKKMIEKMPSFLKEIYEIRQNTEEEKN
jgi:hypothetical protein